jgi:hypothetical protein
VIEKAYKKLRLDALVIQQGRLTEGAKGAKVCGQYQDCFQTLLYMSAGSSQLLIAPAAAPRQLPSSDPSLACRMV